FAVIDVRDNRKISNLHVECTIVRQTPEVDKRPSDSSLGMCARKSGWRERLGESASRRRRYVRFERRRSDAYNSERPQPVDRESPLRVLRATVEDIAGRKIDTHFRAKLECFGDGVVWERRDGHAKRGFINVRADSAGAVVVIEPFDAAVGGEH